MKLKAENQPNRSKVTKHRSMQCQTMPDCSCTDFPMRYIIIGAFIHRNKSFFLNSFVLLVKSEASKTSTNTKGVIFIKEELNDVSSVTSGGLHHVKAEHNAHRI